MDKRVIIENFEKQEAEYISKGYQRIDEVISIKKANLMAFVTAGPFAVLGILLWIVLKDKVNFSWEFSDLLKYFILFGISIFFHECLHGLGWMLFTKGGWKSIHLGVMKELLTPYCHCKEPLKPKQYLIGVLAPFMVLGILMYILAFILNSGLILALSLSSMIAAGGDTTIAIMELKYLNQKDCCILDHPTDCGFVVLKK